MATRNERYGWQWTQDEREDRKEPVWRLQRQTYKLEEQVRRIKEHLPQFAEPAGQVLRAVTSGLKPLLCLNVTNRGPKYYAISPEEADRLIEAAPRLLQLWAAFATSPEFAAAVRQANRDIRRRNAVIREHSRAAEAAYAAMWERVRPAFELLHKGDVGGALDHAAKSGLL